MTWVGEHYEQTEITAILHNQADNAFGLSDARVLTLRRIAASIEQGLSGRAPSPRRDTERFPFRAVEAVRAITDVYFWNSGHIDRVEASLYADDGAAKFWAEELFKIHEQYRRFELWHRRQLVER